tara:strand:- start:43 stop:372 length:330 start_codon:yes stop_codon:yes gene_type:complete
MQDCNMGDNPKKNALADFIHVEGIRLYGPHAKKLGFDTKKGAYFCLWKTILDWEDSIRSDNYNLPQKLESLSSYGIGTITNLEAKDRFLNAFAVEYKDYPEDFGKNNFL